MSNLTATPTFSAFSGDTINLNTQVLNPDGTPYDLTSVTGISYTLSNGYGQPVLVAKTLGAGISITSAVSGMYTITLSPADTTGFAGNYLHASTLSSGSTVNTVFSGILALTAGP